MPVKRQTSFKTQTTAIESYKAYVVDMDYVSAKNKQMALMSSSTVDRYLGANRRAFARFQPQ